LPIGAVIGGAAIAAGGSVAAGAISSKAQKKAANKASDTATANANANNALQRDIYGQNKALLSPYSNNGLAASNALTDLLLGTSGGAPASSALGGYTNPGYRDGAAGVDWNAYINSQPDVAYDYSLHRDMSPEEYGPWHYAQDGSRRNLTPYTPSAQPAPATTPATTPSALSAFDKFREGTNYQWRYNQGLNANRGAFATKGALDSGAAIKSAETYGQNIASGELSNYMNLLASQQAMGLSAAGAVAGVGTTYAGNVAAQNTNASNVAANAALVSGQANANMWGTVGQTAGQVGGALFQYGMGSMKPATNFNSGYGSYNSAYTMPVSNVQPLPYVPGGF
jgi:hypothetical protein